MFDKGVVPVDEFAKKLINQGMILGTSAFVHRIVFAEKDENPKDIVLSEFLKSSPKIFVPNDYAGDKYMGDIISILNNKYSLSNENISKLMLTVIPVHVKVKYVNASDELNIEGLKSDSEFGDDYTDAEFIPEEGVFKVKREVEKMSKSKYNVVNPDDIVSDYGADSLRLYEMFLGPLEQYKPWNTAGITGVHNFLKKLWKLYVDDNGLKVSDQAATKDALKTLHKTIKKVQEDIENFSFNTSVSTFMIAVNELTAQKFSSKDVLEPLLVLLSPYAPHIAEELWNQLGNSESISTAEFPEFDASHLVESSKNYPISFNGKMRFTLELPMDMSKEDIEKTVLAHEKTKEQLGDRTPKKVIVVPGKIVNIVG